MSLFHCFWLISKELRIGGLTRRTVFWNATPYSWVDGYKRFTNRAVTISIVLYLEGRGSSFVQNVC